MSSGTAAGDCVPTIIDYRAVADRGNAPPVDWDGDVSEEGHQSFSVTFLVEVCDPEDGPWTALQCPELPACGAPFEVGNDFNARAFAGCARKAKRHRGGRGGGETGDPGTGWLVTVPYSTKGKSRCCDFLFDDPLNEPVKVSLEMDAEKEEALENFDGTRIETSSHEVVRGPQNEWDRNDFKVTIQDNVIDPQLDLVTRFSAKGGALNDDVLWGLPAGCVRFCAPFKAEEDYFGTCYKYYKRTMTFHIKRDGHNRTVVDEGTKALNGHWGNGQGSGATVSIGAVAGGGILTASLGAGGSGYPRSSTVSLIVSGGSGGVVRVRTNSSGVCISEDFAVAQSGSGYAAGGPYATSGGGSGWILDDVVNPCDGTKGPPDPDNPAHFARYVDRTGNPASVILDGHGLPYDPCVETQQWWCVNDGVNPFTLLSTCGPAVQSAQNYSPDAELTGPFANEAAAKAACTESGFGLGEDPADVQCPDGGPGQVVIERCPPADLTLLGIPLIIGGP